VLSNDAGTLEELVMEMPRPMLKSWLDNNLPGLVQRTGNAEIEGRVARLLADLGPRHHITPG
jgi:cell pole-organizing protein PopZ